MMRLIYVLTCIIILSAKLYAGEETLIELAKDYYRNGDYYNAITESMRYQYLYQQKTFYAESLLLMSKAFYMGGDTLSAISTAEKCSEQYASGPHGDYALYLTGRMRLAKGSAETALRSYDKYLRIHENSLYTEEVYRDRCYGAVFTEDFDLAKNWIDEYKKKYPQGNYLAHVEALAIDVTNEELRPPKSVNIATISSAIIPGSGYFYTGNYLLGTFSFITNAVLIAVIVDGIMRKNTFQWAFFGLLELSFYQHSIYGARNSVYQYNSRNKFISRMKLNFEHNFDL